MIRVTRKKKEKKLVSFHFDDDSSHCLQSSHYGQQEKKGSLVRLRLPLNNKLAEVVMSQRLDRVDFMVYATDISTHITTC